MTDLLNAIAALTHATEERHNARPSRILATTTIPPGTIQIAEDFTGGRRQILIHPDDLERICETTAQGDEPPGWPRYIYGIPVETEQ